MNSEKYKEFVNQEMEKEKYIVYDTDVDINDLYSLDFHQKNKNVEDIMRFNKLNDFILSIDQRICRKINKKEIVFKKDKLKNIISMVITKHEGIKVFMLKEIENFDNEMRFITISEKNCKPLKKCMKIKSDEDMSYVKLIINEYLKKVLQ